MTEAPPLILLIALFVAVLLLLEGLYRVCADLLGRSSQQMNRRLTMIGNSQAADVVLRKLQRDIGGPLNALLVRSLPSLERLLTESGAIMSMSRLLALMIAGGLGLAVIINSILPSFAASVLAGVSLAAVCPIAMLRYKRAQRIAKFGRQLPEAINLMVRGLQVGHPVAAAMGLVAKQMADPIGSEFGLVVDEVAYGRPLIDALANLARRVPHQDLRYLIAVVQIQHQSGGNLAEVMKNLSAVIRARFQMFAKIKAVSAEGRMSAIFIGLMPIAMIGIITVIRPDYYAAVANDPMFWPIMGTAPFMLIAGWFVMWRLINFKV